MHVRTRVETKPGDPLEYKLLEANDPHAMKRAIGDATAAGWELVSHRALPGASPSVGISFAAVLSRPRVGADDHAIAPRRR